jgi:hypothetical protein
MSLIDASIVESARKAVAAVQDWFDDGYMPDGPKKEIEVIVNNPLIKQARRGILKIVDSRRSLEG